MDVSIVNLQTLFAKPMRYEIPLFQRPYVRNALRVQPGRRCHSRER